MALEIQNMFMALPLNTNIKFPLSIPLMFHLNHHIQLFFKLYIPRFVHYMAQKESTIYLPTHTVTQNNMINIIWGFKIQDQTLLI